MPEEGRPIRIAAAGWALTLLGCLLAIAIVAGARGAADPTTILWVGGTTAALLLTAGLGLVLARRWAWPLAVVFGLLVLAGATRMLARPDDLPSRNAGFLILAAVPVAFAATLLACLLTPRSFRWLWADGRADRADGRADRDDHPL